MTVYWQKPCFCHHWPPCEKHIQNPHSRNRYSYPSTSRCSIFSCCEGHTVLIWHSYLPSGTTVLVVQSGGKRKPGYGLYLMNPSYRPNRLLDDPFGVFLYTCNFLPILGNYVQPSQDVKYPLKLIKSRRVTLCIFKMSAFLPSPALSDCSLTCCYSEFLS